MDKVFSVKLQTNSPVLFWKYWDAYYQILTIDDASYKYYLEEGKSIISIDRGYVENFESLSCIKITTDEMIAALAYLKLHEC